MTKFSVAFLLFCTTVSGVFAGIPVRPRILPGTAAATEAVVFWELPADYKDMKHYVVRVDGRRAGTTGHNNLRITGLRPATTYRVQVAAVDAAGREHKARAIELRTKSAPQIFDVRDYGAAGDGRTLDTKAIQQAIDACTPGGEVYVPAGDYLTGALFICKSDISLHLDEGATLRAVNNLGHFPMVKNIYEGWVKEVFASVLNIGRLYGDRYENIRVYGGGTIDNQGSVLADQQIRTVGRMARSHGMPVIRCDNVAFDNVTITNPCTWNVHPLLCEGFTTYGCRLVSSGFGLSNADGWDPDSSSECYLLESVLDGQDDNIAVKSVVYPAENGEKILKPAKNIFVSHCRFVRGGGLVVGAEVPAGASNVWFTDCVVEGSDRGFHVCSRPFGTRPVEGIHFRDIEVKNTGCWGINVTVWYWVPSYLPGAYGPDELLKVRDVSFENIRIDRADGNPIQVLGVAEQPMENISFRNVTVAESQYDVLLRNVRGVKFENVQVGERYWVLDNAEEVERDALTSAPKTMNYPHELADPDATYRTKALYDNLHKVARSGRFLFGAQDATASGFGWCDDSGRSDIERISGKKPAFYSWDFMDIVDANGNLIGINSAKAADTGVEGMGYAIPINTASPILDELMNRTTRAKVTDSEELGFLGVDARDVSEEARQIYNLPAGAFVYSVVEGSPAEKAGIKKGDIITKLDGITISSRNELFSRMEYYKAGETIDVVVKTAQGGEYLENTFSVTLAKKSEYTSSSDGSSDSSGSQSQDQGNSQDNSQGQDNGQSQPRQYYEYDGNGSDGYSGNGGNSGSDSYDSLEDFFRQFQQ